MNQETDYWAEVMLELVFFLDESLRLIRRVLEYADCPCMDLLFLHLPPSLLSSTSLTTTRPRSTTLNLGLVQNQTMAWLCSIRDDNERYPLHCFRVLIEIHPFGPKRCASRRRAFWWEYQEHKGWYRGRSRSKARYACRPPSTLELDAAIRNVTLDGLHPYEYSELYSFHVPPQAQARLAESSTNYTFQQIQPFRMNHLLPQPIVDSLCQSATLDYEHHDSEDSDSEQDTPSVYLDLLLDYDSREHPPSSC